MTSAAALRSPGLAPNGAQAAGAGTPEGAAFAALLAQQGGAGTPTTAVAKPVVSGSASASAPAAEAAAASGSSPGAVDDASVEAPEAGATPAQTATIVTKSAQQTAPSTASAKAKPNPQAQAVQPQPEVAAGEAVGESGASAGHAAKSAMHQAKAEGAAGQAALAGQTQDGTAAPGPTPAQTAAPSQAAGGLDASSQPQNSAAELSGDLAATTEPQEAGRPGLGAAPAANAAGPNAPALPAGPAAPGQNAPPPHLSEVAPAPRDSADLAPSGASDQAPASQRAATDHATARSLPPAAQQMVQQIIRRFDGGTSRIELRLDPAELGRIDVRLSVDRDNQVNAQIIADNPATLTDLYRASREIERALTDAGLQLDGQGLSFDLGQDARGGNQTEGQRPRVRATDPADDQGKTAATISVQRWRGHRVDLFA